MIIMCCDKGTITTMAITLQYINVASQHVVHLKLTKCYISDIFQKKMKIDHSESDLKDGEESNKSIRNDDKARNERRYLLMTL